MSELFRKFYLNALLADASYARDLRNKINIENKSFSVALVDDDRFEGKLEDGEVEAKHNNKEKALVIEKNFEFVTQINEPSLFSIDTGFSGMLVKSTGINSTSSEYVFALRGTEPTLGGLGQDIAATDIADIGFEGFAASQAVDMFNWYSITSTPRGMPAMQLEYNEKVLESELDSPNVVSSVYGGLVGAVPAFDVISYSVDAFGTGELPLNATFDVTGHSLGGHLAMMLARIAGDRLGQAYVFNAPGFDSKALDKIIGDLSKTVLFGGPRTEWFLDAIRSAQMDRGVHDITLDHWPEDRITSLDAPLDIVGDLGFKYSQQGEVTPTYLEIYSTLKGNSLSAHFMGGLSETLEVYDGLSILFGESIVNLPFGNKDSSLRPVLNSSIRESSGEKDLEAFVTSIAEFFNVQLSAKGPDDTRTDIQRLLEAIANSTLKQTRDSSGFVTSRQLVDTKYLGMQILPIDWSKPSEVESNIRSNIAYRYSFLNNLSYAIVGKNSLYDSHNQKGELNFTFDNPGPYSKEFIDDKLAQLKLQQVAYGDDLRSGSNQGGVNNRRLDISLPEENYVLRESAKGSTTTLVFGDKNDNSYIGSQFNLGAPLSQPRDSTPKRLYGQGGNDTLNAENLSSDTSSDDILDGGFGTDFLVGGAGRDIIYGGADSDLLVGSSVSIADSVADQLIGGAGADSYFAGNFDQITDIPTDDGFVNLQLDSGTLQPLTGGTRKGNLGVKSIL